MLGQGIHSAGFPVGYMEEGLPVGYREFCLRVFRSTLICLFLGLICWNVIQFNKRETCLEMGVKGCFVVFVFCGMWVKFI